MNAHAPAPGVATDLPLLRRRLRSRRDAGRRRRRGDRRRSRPSRQCRPTVRQGRGARRDARNARRGCSIRPSTACARPGRARSTPSPAGFTAALDAHGPRRRSRIYLSGQLLTEDYYVANKLMKGFLGSANVDTNSRLCMASSVAGHRRAFGADVVPGCYDDFDAGRSHRLRRIERRLVPSRTVSARRAGEERGAARASSRSTRAAPRPARAADLHLPIAPGADTMLFARLLVEIADGDAFDRAYVDAHTSGFGRRSRSARAIAPDRATTAARCGLAEPDLATFLDLWIDDAARRHRFQPGRQPVGAGDRQGQRDPQRPSRDRAHRQAGLRPVLADRPAQRDGRSRGRRPRQPARRAYGLPPADVDRVRRFWKAPAMATAPGLKAVELFEAIERGEIKALWVMSTNPARQPAARRRHARRARQARLPRRLRGQRPCRRPSRRRDRRAAGGGVGREGRHSRQIRSGAFRASGRFAAARARRGRIGGRSARSRGGSATAQPSPIAAQPTSSASTRRYRAFENDGARAFDIGGLADAGRRRIRRARADAMAASTQRESGGSGSFRKAASFIPTAARALSPSRTRRRRG